MSVLDSFFRNKDKKAKSISSFEDESPDHVNKEIPREESSADTFLDLVGDLALRQKIRSSSNDGPALTDLTTISLSDFPEVDSTELTLKKIEELKSIISSIESKSNETQEIVLTKSYKINYRNELNTTQLEAVTTINGPVLVIAGAGSGKTRVIIHRVAFMLENGIDPGEILLLTFTRKAASEMIGRVQGLLNDNKAQKVFGGTFHSFSNYILRKYANLLGIPSNFTIIDSEDSADTIDLIKSELKIEKKEKAFPKKNRIQEIISSARNRNLTIRNVILNEFSGLVEFIDQLELINLGYEKYKKICRIFDYDDLMEVLRDSLRDNLNFRRRLNDQFRFIMVDEYREKGIALNQIAILVRAFWHARYIEIELKRRSIPYIAVGGLAFNERKHVKDIISYLRIVQNPYDAVAWHRILKYIPGVGLVTARKIIEKIISEKGLETKSFENTKFAEGLSRLTAMISKASDNTISIARKIEIILEYYVPILQATESDYQIRLLDISVLADLSSRYDLLDKFLTDFALDPPSKKFGNKTTPLIDESEDKPLTVSTIHSAKGLEWYSVMIPHALDGLIPSVRALNNIEEIEEERRLFYVACSRAKQDLIITMPSYVSTYNAFLSYPSRFLVEIGKEKFYYK
jgi:superfamily I DNA/RNA helicase